MGPDDLKRIRTRLDLTQGEFAAKLGVTRVTVTRWETGTRKISPPMALLIDRIAAEERRRKRGR